jgi:hypothetical protein
MAPVLNFWPLAFGDWLLAKSKLQIDKTWRSTVGTCSELMNFNDRDVNQCKLLPLHTVIFVKA